MPDDRGEGGRDAHALLQVGLAGLDGGGEEAGEAVGLGGLEVGRPLLGALVAEEHVALVETHRAGELLLPGLRALEPELRVQIGGRGGDGRLRCVRSHRRCEEGVPGSCRRGGRVGGVGHEEGEGAVLQ